MHRWLPIWVPALAVLSLLTGVASAQVPKVHNRFWYVDDSDLGFRVKVPEAWEFVPPQPGETSLIGKYDPPHNTYISIGRDEELWLHGWIVKFDRRPKPEPAQPARDEDGKTITITLERQYRDIGDWIPDHVEGVAWRKVEDSDLKLRDIEAREYQFSATGRSQERPEIRAYAAVFRVSPEVDVAIVYNGPGDKRKWKDYEKSFVKFAKSFERVEVVGQDDPGLVATDGSPRAQKRAKLLDEVRRTPGWQLYETPNYLIISNNEDKEFIDELMERLEKIRAVYETDYPPAKARRAAKRPASGGDKPEGDAQPEDGPAQPEEQRSVSVRDPFELSRTSVVRVCKDQNQYHSYGGPGGSAGYWASFHEELVIYDDKASGGRQDTWAVLNHEAFHQYIFYFYGELAPHSWYNEGTGDFYAGYYYKNGRMTLKPFLWRTGTVKEAIRTGKYAPLEDFVRWTQAEYYGSNDLGLDGFANYAQGWSFIYFLRNGKQKARGWNDAWDHILDTYLDTLADTGDLDRAVDVAFEGVDWQQLEEAWKGYIG